MGAATIETVAVELGSFRAATAEQLKAIRGDIRVLKLCVSGDDGEGGLRQRIIALETCNQTEEAGRTGMSKGLRLGLVAVVRALGG